MQRKYVIIVLSIIFGMSVTSCTGIMPKDGSESTAVFETSAAQYIEEAEEIYQAYLDTYLRDASGAEDFYDESFPAEQSQLKTEEKENIFSAKLHGLTEVSLDEQAYNLYLKENFGVTLVGYDAIRAYMAHVYMGVRKDSKFNYAGMNYKYCIMGKKNGKWKILPSYPESTDIIREYIMQEYKKCGNELDKRRLNIAFINYADSPAFTDKYGHLVEGTEEEIDKLNEWLQKEYERYGINGRMVFSPTAKQCREEVEEMYQAYLEAYMQSDSKTADEFDCEWIKQKERERSSEEKEEAEKDRREERERILSAEFYNLIEVPLNEEDFRRYFETMYGNDSDIFEEYDVIRAYLIGVDMRLNGITSSSYSGIYNGVNYKYRIVGRKDGEWKFLPTYQNGSGIFRDYIIEACKKAEDEGSRRYLNIAFINHAVAPVCVDGYGNIVEGTEEEIERLNEWLLREYEAYEIEDGLVLNVGERKVVYQNKK